MGQLKVCVKRTCPSGTGVSGLTVQLSPPSGPSGTTGSDGCVTFYNLKEYAYFAIYVNGVFCQTVLVLPVPQTVCITYTAKMKTKVSTLALTVLLPHGFPAAGQAVKLVPTAAASKTKKASAVRFRVPESRPNSLDEVPLEMGVALLVVAAGEYEVFVLAPDGEVLSAGLVDAPPTEAGEIAYRQVQVEL